MSNQNGVSERNGVSNGRENGNSNQNGHHENFTVSPKVLAKVCKSRSFAELSLRTNAVMFTGKNEKKVLVLYTGGTIGMTKNSEGGSYGHFNYVKNITQLFRECQV